MKQDLANTEAKLREARSALEAAKSDPPRGQQCGDTSLSQCGVLLAVLACADVAALWRFAAQLGVFPALAPTRAAYWGSLVGDPALPLAEARTVCQRLSSDDNAEELLACGSGN